MSDPVQIVWFKRDLRVRDHRPLTTAARRGPVLPLYVAEPVEGDFAALPLVAQEHSTSGRQGQCPGRSLVVPATGHQHGGAS